MVVVVSTTDRNVRQRLADRACRKRVIAHYGGKCACCDEDEYEFLAIDHIDGGGNEHRKEINRGGKFHRWLEARGYPEGYRILCHNCNQAIGTYGYCPHERLRLVENF